MRAVFFLFLSLSSLTGLASENECPLIFTHENSHQAAIAYFVKSVGGDTRSFSEMKIKLTKAENPDPTHALEEYNLTLARIAEAAQNLSQRGLWDEDMVLRTSYLLVQRATEYLDAVGAKYRVTLGLLTGPTIEFSNGDQSPLNHLVKVLNFGYAGVHVVYFPYFLLTEGVATQFISEKKTLVIALSDITRLNMNSPLIQHLLQGLVASAIVEQNEREKNADAGSPIPNQGSSLLSRTLN